MKRIIHLSDLHVGYPGLDGRLGKVLEGIVRRAVPASEFVVLVTGDLVESAFDAAARRLARRRLRMLEQAGYALLVVPGNHDVGDGAFGLKRYARSFTRSYFGERPISYPKLDVVEGVAFVGLDSMAAELHWYDSLGANGELGGRQLRRLASLLACPEVEACARTVVYLHHHPFDPEFLHELKDAEALGEVLRGAPRPVDALLYGHNHHARVHNGTWGIPRCYDGGSATGKEGSRIVHRVIDLSLDPAADVVDNFLVEA
jgi:3',5'-cyclic AMP phosphodiesterase CpdA